MFNRAALLASQRTELLPEAFVHYVQRPRVTLGNRRYDDLVHLRTRAIEATYAILQHWRVPKADIDAVSAGMSLTTFQGLARGLAAERGMTFDAQSSKIPVRGQQRSRPGSAGDGGRAPPHVDHRPRPAPAPEGPTSTGRDGRLRGEAAAGGRLMSPPSTGWANTARPILARYVAGPALFVVACLRYLRVQHLPHRAAVARPLHHDPAPDGAGPLRPAITATTSPALPLSIVVPVFNGGERLRRCLDSVLAQVRPTPMRSSASTTARPTRRGRSCTAMRRATRS